MNGDASITMLINRDLSPDEQKRFEPLDQAISTALMSAGITTRCGWAARNESGVRILELVVWTEDERAVMKISSTELLIMSDQSLLERPRKSLA
jgi:hypothetical protein